MEPFRWRRAFFLGLVSSAASLAGLVVDTFVPVVLQTGHPLWHNTTSLHAPLVGFALAPSLAFFIMTWDNMINMVVHPWAGVRSDQTWTRWGRRKPWILVGAPLAVTGLVALPLAPTLAGVLVALLVTNVGRALYAHLRQDKLYIKENEGILHEVKLFPCAYRRSLSCSCP